MDRFARIDESKAGNGVELSGAKRSARSSAGVPSWWEAGALRTVLFFSLVSYWCLIVRMRRAISASSDEIGVSNGFSPTMVLLLRRLRP